MSQYIPVGAFPLTTTLSIQDRLTAGLRATTTGTVVAPTTTAPAPEPGFFSKYGIYLLGAAAVGGIIWWRRRAGGRR